MVAGRPERSLQDFVGEAGNLDATSKDGALTMVGPLMSLSLGNETRESCT